MAPDPDPSAEGAAPSPADLFPAGDPAERTRPDPAPEDLFRPASRRPAAPDPAAPEPRLTADLWVRAYLRRLELALIPAYVTRKGDPTAGAVLVKVATLDGQARALQRSFDLATDRRVWVTLAEGPEAEVDATLARQRARDPDLWIIEIEDRAGRTLLGEEGLA